MDDLRSATADATVSSGILLELAAMVEPYRQRGRRLSIRIERLPARARLSKGANNGDRTWSLTLDELDGLVYLPPEDMNEAHTLAVRIVNLDESYGATLAVLDLPISLEQVLSRPVTVAADRPGGAASAGVDLRHLRDDLAQIKASLAARETEMAETRQDVEHAWAEKSKRIIEAELTSARNAWEGELAQRLAEGAEEAAKNLAEAHAAWQAEQEHHLAALEARAEARIRQAREQWQEEAGAALTKAEEAWKANEAARLAAAEAQWREQSAAALAEATERLERDAKARARPKREDAELRKLSRELAEAKAALAAREAEFAETRHQIEHHLAELETRTEARIQQAREQWQEEAGAALAKAEETWKTSEAARLAAAEAQWREQSERDAKTRARPKREDAELRSLRSALAEATASLAAREAELAETRHQVEPHLAELEARAEARIRQAREQWQEEATAALTKAEEAWKTGEATRLAAAEAQWREQSAVVLAEATERLERADTQARARSSREDAELRSLCSELAGAKASLAAREAELIQIRSASETEVARRPAESEHEAEAHIRHAREQWQEEAAAALTKAEEAWKAGETARLAAAEAQWREQSAATLAEATGRIEWAEAALAEAHAQTKRDDAALLGLRADLTEAKASLAASEAELSATRQDIERAWAEKLERTIEAERSAWEAEAERRLSESEERAQERIEQARDKWEEEARVALTKAEEAWRASEIAGLAAAEQSARALAEATQRFERAEAALAEAHGRTKRDDAELRSLCRELADVKALLAAREAELAGTRHKVEHAPDDAPRQAIEAELAAARAAWEAEVERRLAESEERAEERFRQAREQSQQEARVALNRAEEAWKAGEAARLAQWREHSNRALAAATGRFERAEAALVEARERPRREEAEFRNLRGELAETKATLAALEVELAQAQSALKTALERRTAIPQVAPKTAAGFGKVREAQKLSAERRQRVNRGFVGGTAVLVALAAVISFYLPVEPNFLEGWLKIVSPATETQPPPPNVEPPIQPQAPEREQGAKRRTVAVANVRALPSTAAPVVTILPRDTEVTPLERRGKWVLIRIAGGDGVRKQEGWIYEVYLSDAAGSRDASGRRGRDGTE